MIDDQDLRAQQANESLLETIIGIAAAIDERHPTTRGHSQNVAHVSALLAHELSLPVDRIEEVRLAGLLHDVGKIGVTDELISRPGPLTDAEWEEMRDIRNRISDAVRCESRRCADLCPLPPRADRRTGLPDRLVRRADPAREPNHRRRERARLHDQRPALPDRHSVPATRSAKSCRSRVPSSARTWWARSSGSWRATPPP